MLRFVKIRKPDRRSIPVGLLVSCEIMMNRIDWNLLVLAAADGKPLDPAQLQKVLFLLQERNPQAVTDRYDFQPYDYGPFDSDVYADASKLEEYGLAIVCRTAGGWKTYAATVEGLRQARRLSEQADKTAVEYVKKAVAWARSLSFTELIREIYKAYPNMRVNSKFRD